MILSVLNWLAKHLDTFLIPAPDKSDYLLRVRLHGRLPKEPEKGSWSLYLHKILAPDLDRELHNHPWTWSFSIILAGGYTEQRLLKDGRVITRTLKPLRINILGPDQFHRITELHGAETWTLFFTGRKTTTWGFLDKVRGFIPSTRRKAHA